MPWGKAPSTWTAGCGAFGLLSVLLGVGISVYLGSRVIESTGGLGGRVTVTTAPPVRAPVQLRPEGGFAEGQRVVVTATQLPAGSTAFVLQCARPETGAAACVSGTPTAATVDADGRLAAAIRVHRLLQLPAGGLDCGDPGAHCEIQVQDSDGDVLGTAELAFAA